MVVRESTEWLLGGLVVGEVTAARQAVTRRGGLSQDSGALWISEASYEPLEDLKTGVVHVDKLQTDSYGLIRSACWKTPDGWEGLEAASGSWLVGREHGPDRFLCPGTHV